MKRMDVTDVDALCGLEKGDKQMNILIIALSCFTAEKYYLTQLSKALLHVSKDINITLILPEYVSSENFNGKINIIRVSIPNDVFGSMLKVLNLFFYRDLVKKIGIINPNIIHIQNELRFPFFYEWLLHRNYPVIVTVHEPKPFSVKKTITSSIKDFIQIINCRLLIKFSNKIIVHGEKHKEYLLSKKVPSSKIEIIPHGDFSSFFINKEKREIKSSKHHILFFGRIDHYKGIEYLIQAGKLVKEYISDISITIAGNGDFTKYNELIGQDKNFLVINEFISEKAAAELFQETSVVVLPYIDGSQSGIISIAYAFEKPVITTNVGNFAEMVEDGKTGLIVPPRDANSLSEAIIKLLQDDDLRGKMGENGKKLLEGRYNWNNIAEKINKIYEELT